MNLASAVLRGSNGQEGKMKSRMKIQACQCRGVVVADGHFARSDIAICQSLAPRQSSTATANIRNVFLVIDCWSLICDSVMLGMYNLRMEDSRTAVAVRRANKSLLKYFLFNALAHTTAESS